MKKALIILGAVVLGTSTNLSVVGCGNKEEPALTSISTIIKNNNLGDIAMSQLIPTKEELLIGIQNANPITAKSLTKNDFDIKDKSDTSNNPAKITITGKGNYTGDVTLNYSKQMPITDQEIVDAISAITDYKIGQQIKKGSYDELQAKILPNFIKSKIKNQRVKDAFIENNLKILKITKDDGKTELKDDDLTAAGTSIPNAKIIFNYHNLQNKTVNLAINVSSIGAIDAIDDIAVYLKLNSSPKTSTIDQAFYWDSASSSYKWNIGVDSAQTGDGKDFDTIDFRNLLKNDGTGTAKDNAETFLVDTLNLSKKDNNTFNPSDLDQFSVKMVPDSYLHGDISQKKNKDGEYQGWVANEAIKAQIYIMQNKTIILNTYNVKTQWSQLHINSKGKDIKMQSTDFTGLKYQVGTTAKNFNASIKLNFSTDNTKRLMKLAKEINVATDETDTDNFEFKITDKGGTPLLGHIPLAKDTDYKITIAFKGILQSETVNSKCELPPIQ